MLPRGVEFVKILHSKQRIISQRAVSQFKNQLFVPTCRQILENNVGENINKNVLIMQRLYTTKDKIIASPPIQSSSSTVRSDIPTTQTKTTKKTATEPKKSVKENGNDVLEETTTKAEGVKKTKKFEVETSKGILSITTTIEDSKINDIVFEKTKGGAKKAAAAVKTAAKTATTTDKSSSKPAKEAAKVTTTKLDAALTDVVKQAAAAQNEAASKTVILDMAATPTVANITAVVADPVPEVKPKPKRVKVDLNRSSLERNFITPARAMSDFLLKASDLETLPKIKRRSPYEQEPPITVYWRKDVEAKAINIWGSKENLIKECLKREIERKTHQQNIFTVKRRLRDYRREIGSRAAAYDDEPGLRGKSGKVVLIAIAINGLNFLFKVGGWLFSGSHSMFAESIHSLADTINQCILAYGIHKSTQMADSDHPYGYTNMKYVSSLISGVGIFCVGTGLSFYHGITGLMHPEPMENFFWAFFILGGSLVSEGATLLVAVNEVRRSAKLKGISFKDYVVQGKDPCVNVVLTEDAAAVTSVAVAAACMGLSTVTGSPIYDAVGSLLVGSILGAVASFIIYTNVAALVGQSIPREQLDRINSELESDVMIRAIHDVKGIDIGNSLVRYKAEMDFDGRELARSYLDKQDLNELLKIVKSFQNTDELEQFLLNHGENIVDLMGGEIDRIEMKLRKKFPEIRHCDLEIL
ncbi:zinc transporter 9 [Lucilia sericata]|uniref:zinc transporter 9 n=1 Tax=Lucilia sericata TaxID=13632 RepID=UPI0018A829C7|nr:zinc transporter 9 [Lucilia sericata]XP_037818141.1 zinc transporter 9 [Lucilia sericata]XP_037818142.1 zinc transporter 9 [Lucilia sericata]